MSEAVVVRYRVTEEALEQNIALVRAVYDELAAKRPPGLQYSTYCVDERTFEHVAVLEASGNPLDDLSAFHAFTADIAERCEDGPQVARGEVVGRYVGG
jgi:hypothetical protein